MNFLLLILSQGTAKLTTSTAETQEFNSIIFKHFVKAIKNTYIVVVPLFHANFSYRWWTFDMKEFWSVISGTMRKNKFNKKYIGVPMRFGIDETRSHKQQNQLTKTNIIYYQKITT